MFNSKYANGTPRTSGNDLPVSDGTEFERGSSETRKYDTIPKLLVGWDTETTGFPNYTAEEESEPGAGDKGRPAIGRPISYGLVVYRNGIEQPHEHEHFLTLNNAKISPISSGAYGMAHKISQKQLNSSYMGKITKDYTGNTLEPALYPSIAATRFLQRLSHYQKQGAVFLGHNLGFDYSMLDEAHKDSFDSLSPTQFDIDLAKHYTIDTMHHARVRGEKGFDPSKTKKSDSLTGCCNYHGIKPGGHTAVDDAKAAVQLFFNQVADNINGLPIKQSSKGESLIDYKKISPFCTGENCASCLHIDQADAANRDKKGKIINKRHEETIKNVKILHKDIEGLKKGK